MAFEPSTASFTNSGPTSPRGYLPSEARDQRPVPSIGRFPSSKTLSPAPSLPGLRSASGLRVSGGGGGASPRNERPISPRSDVSAENPGSLVSPRRVEGAQFNYAAVRAQFEQLQAPQQSFAPPNRKMGPSPNQSRILSKVSSGQLNAPLLSPKRVSGNPAVSPQAAPSQTAPTQAQPKLPAPAKVPVAHPGTAKTLPPKPDRPISTLPKMAPKLGNPASPSRPLPSPAPKKGIAKFPSTGPANAPPNSTSNAPRPPPRPVGAKAPLALSKLPSNNSQIPARPLPTPGLARPVSPGPPTTAGLDRPVSPSPPTAQLSNSVRSLESAPSATQQSFAMAPTLSEEASSLAPPTVESPPGSSVDVAPLSQAPVSPRSMLGRKRADGVPVRPANYLPASTAPNSLPAPQQFFQQTNMPSQSISARRYVINEIVDTEESFVQDISNAISWFLVPLRSNPKLISAVELGKLFANMEMIQITSTEMATELRQAVSAASTPEEALIGGVFCKNATTLESAFAQYCRANAEALQILGRLRKKSAFSTALDNLEATDVAKKQSLGLLSYLVKPVQRVCKYPLLLRELQKNTDPAHPDAELVVKALDVIGRLVDKVNLTARETENISHLLRVENQLTETPSGLKLIMPGRRFLREGRWMKVSGKHVQERHVFLFNDMIIYAKPAVLAKNKYIFKGVVPLHEGAFEPYQDGTTQMQNSLKITRLDNKKSYILFDDSNEQKRDEWLNDIANSQKEDPSGADGGVVVGAFHMAETSPDARRDAVTMLAIETKIASWSNDSPQRRFIASGPLKYVLAGSSDSSSDVENRGFLFFFSDCAVFTRQVKHNQARVPFLFRDSFEFSSALVQDLDVVDLDGDKQPYFAFAVSSVKKQRRAVLLFPTLEEKTEWLTLFGSSGAELTSSPRDAESSAPGSDVVQDAVPTSPLTSPQLARTASSPPTVSPTSRPSFRLPAGVSPRGSFSGEMPDKDGAAALKTKKSFFGKKLGYKVDERGRGGSKKNLLASDTSSSALDVPEEQDNDAPESVEGFEIPPWEPDDSADNCNQCGTKFSATTRKHHCRNCGKIFCAKCTSKKCMLPRYGFTKKKVRVCDGCFINH